MHVCGLGRGSRAGGEGARERLSECTCGCGGRTLCRGHQDRPGTMIHWEGLQGSAHKHAHGYDPSPARYKVPSVAGKEDPGVAGLQPPEPPVGVSRDELSSGSTRRHRTREGLSQGAQQSPGARSVEGAVVLPRHIPNPRLAEGEQVLSRNRMLCTKSLDTSHQLGNWE